MGNYNHCFPRKNKYRIKEGVDINVMVPVESSEINHYKNLDEFEYNQSKQF